MADSYINQSTSFTDTKIDFEVPADTTAAGSIAQWHR